MKIMVIVNPTSGVGRGAKAGKEIASYSENLDIFFTTPEKTATDFAKEAVKERYQRVIVVGGDGTLHEVANGLIGSDISMGIIPRGVGNDFSKALEIPQNTKEAFQVALTGQVIPIDLGKIDDKYFINVVSFGIDAQLVQYIPELKKKHRFFPGEGMYLYALLKQLSFPLDYPKMWITFKEVGIPKTFGQHTTTLVISNGTQYGEKFKIAPQAILDDGFLDICWIKKMDKAKILKALPKLIRGTHADLPEVQIYRLKSLTVHPETKVACQVDGETFDFKDEYSISVVPKALNVVVPQKQGPQIIEIERSEVRAPMLQPA